ncbi:Regulator of chromosome condensation RCC1 (Precursor), related, related [Eimeria tenella]|uniref:Regulator of chromosome condensation RCC1 (Precursor), related, related n=1 Tax=Eimeria tenella TaxID=5802 RepID=U6L821_EIMTE|nr:Regulator of chromosome condensation RCC1 (Precursor), related, related [Eimeria tenella]CDJ45358.1 Regulator of chromosome condensation RCC1 (Precursor), related, related [Eimeria tenella]|eukprot:XP_013236104.1 Regulator of chromosome condensation RCC1 (Precursor), related, related [Eimeria tenella]
MDAARRFVLSHHLPIQQWLWRGRQMPTKTHHLCGPQLLKGLGSFATRVVCGGTHCAAICAADRSSEEQLLQQLLQQLDWKSQKHKSTLSSAVVREGKNKKEGKKLGRPSKLFFSRPLQQYRAKLAQQTQKKKRTERKLPAPQQEQQESKSAYSQSGDKLLMWGRGSEGQLGLNSIRNVVKPIELPFLQDPKRPSYIQIHRLALGLAFTIAGVSFYPSSHSSEDERSRSSSTSSSFASLPPPLEATSKSASLDWSEKTSGPHGRPPWVPPLCFVQTGPSFVSIDKTSSTSSNAEEKTAGDGGWTRTVLREITVSEAAEAIRCSSFSRKEDPCRSLSLRSFPLQAPLRNLLPPPRRNTFSCGFSGSAEGSFPFTDLFSSAVSSDSLPHCPSASFGKYGGHSGSHLRPDRSNLEQHACVLPIQLYAWGSNEQQQIPLSPQQRQETGRKRIKLPKRIDLEALAYSALQNTWTPPLAFTAASFGGSNSNCSGDSSNSGKGAADASLQATDAAVTQRIKGHLFFSQRLRTPLQILRNYRKRSFLAAAPSTVAGPAGQIRRSAANEAGEPEQQSPLKAYLSRLLTRLDSLGGRDTEVGERQAKRAEGTGDKTAKKGSREHTGTTAAAKNRADEACLSSSPHSMEVTPPQTKGKGEPLRSKSCTETNKRSPLFSVGSRRLPISVLRKQANSAASNRYSRQASLSSKSGGQPFSSRSSSRGGGVCNTSARNQLEAQRRKGELSVFGSVRRSSASRSYTIPTDDDPPIGTRGELGTDGVWRSIERVTVKDIAAGETHSLLLLEISYWERICNSRSSSYNRSP